MPAGAAIAAAAIGAAGSAAGGAASKKGAKSAADTQAQAASHAADLSYKQYQQTREDLAPFRFIGYNASDLLAQMLGLPSTATLGQPAPTPSAAPPSGQLNIFGGVSGAKLPDGWGYQAPQPVGNMDSGFSVSPGAITDQTGRVVMTLPPDVTDEASAANFLASMGGGVRSATTASSAPAIPAPSTTDAMHAALARYGLKGLTFQPTQAELEATPGYQFNLAQGLRGVANSLAAKGKGISGEALKGAATFATGLADNTLQTQQGIFQQNLANVINPLEWASNLGQTASTTTGQLGLQGIQNVNAANIGGANALAAGQVGGANALAGAFNGIGNAATNYLLFNNLMKGGGGGGSATPGGSFSL